MEELKRQSDEVEIRFLDRLAIFQQSLDRVNGPKLSCRPLAWNTMLLDSRIKRLA